MLASLGPAFTSTPAFAGIAAARRRPAGLVVAAIVHTALLLALMHGLTRPAAPVVETPLVVALLTPAAPAPAAQREVSLASPATPMPGISALPVPAVHIEPAAMSSTRPEPEPAAALPAAVVERAPSRSEAPTTVVTTPAPVAPTSVPAPRKRLDASAVRYLVMPPAELPRASRRAGESGTVWLRVVVDVGGLPASVSVHRSSGYPRLDEQAVSAMRQARFTPYLDDGRPVEVEVIAPIEYPSG